MSLHIFHCSECQQSKLQYNPDGCGSLGYGYGYARTNPNLPVCFECCAAIDRADMIATGRATLYLTKDNKVQEWFISNWPGSLKIPCGVKIGRHNIAGKRYDAWFRFEGKRWHGVTYGDNTQLCHCRRIK